jgi:hypothetical protein
MVAEAIGTRAGAATQQAYPAQMNKRPTNSHT